MLNNEYDYKLQLLSKEELIKELKYYKSLYNTTNLMLKEMEKINDEYNDEIASLENKTKKLKDEFETYKILDDIKHNNIRDKENEFAKILSICSSAVIIYLTLFYNLKLSFLHFIFLTIPLFLFYLIIYFLLITISSFIHKGFFRELTNNKREQILAFICPYIISIIFIIINIYL